ncbi:MAG TPA: rhodanese-like domain-containing protein, partial [Candidatus Limnocylindrales bacterium]
MAKKNRSAAGRPSARPLDRSSGTRSSAKPPVNPSPLSSGRVRLGLILVTLVAATVVVLGTDFVLGAVFPNGSSSTPAASQSPIAGTTAGPTQFGEIVQGVGGHWTNVTADQLAGMMTKKDFTLVNVKTPYIGEIDKTDLYIPYDQLKARAAQLPADKTARILVYCRSGV